MTKDEFLIKAKEKHGERYVYDEVPSSFKANDKIPIICKRHGRFIQSARCHYRRNGCPICGEEKSKKSNQLNTEGFKEKLIEKFGDIYDTSLLKYVDFETKVKLICPKHGIFEKTPHELMRGRGCQKCSYEHGGTLQMLPREEVINRANKIHNFKYTYDKYDGRQLYLKSIITCPIHGDFEQTMRKHLMGSGCPVCKASKLEVMVFNVLKAKNIDLERQVNERVFSWLKKYSLDFYLPKYNIAIECQGEQHFTPTAFGSKKHNSLEMLGLVKNRDKLKKELCEKNGIKLVYFLNSKYNEYMGENDVYFNDTESLIDYILS